MLHDLLIQLPHPVLAAPNPSGLASLTAQLHRSEQETEGARAAAVQRRGARSFKHCRRAAPPASALRPLPASALLHSCARADLRAACLAAERRTRAAEEQGAADLAACVTWHEERASRLQEAEGNLRRLAAGAWTGGPHCAWGVPAGCGREPARHTRGPG